MKSKFYFVFPILLLMNCSLLRGQFTDLYWTFGDSSAIDFRNLSSPTPGTSILRVKGTCASICDSAGNLLFYGGSPDSTLWLHTTHYNNGYVVNKSNQKMNNGDSIAADITYQSMITVPDPANADRFYLFTSGVTNTPIPGFYYSVIDLSYYGGLGRVVQKNIQLQTFPLTDGITAVKHGNGRDWWVVFKHWDTLNNDFYFYLITPSGLSGPFIQSIGTATTNNLTKMKFAKDGNKLFIVNTGNLIESFDFDRCTGLLSNVNTIEAQSAAGPYNNYWSFGISPLSTKLYITSIANGPAQDTSYLFQFDLTAPNILASKDTLHYFISPVGVGILQPGPDDKIYLSCSYAANDCAPFYLYCDTTWYLENMNISVINYPDNLGAACDFQPFSFYLGGHRSYYGLPNNPNYELGPDTNSVCDTITTVYNILSPLKAKIYIWYNSEWRTAFINAKNLKGKQYNMLVTDLLGKVVFKSDGKIESTFYTMNLNCSHFTSGMYIVSLQTESENLSVRFVKH